MNPQPSTKVRRTRRNDNTTIKTQKVPVCKDPQEIQRMQWALCH